MRHAQAPTLDQALLSAFNATASINDARISIEVL
jgi:hypothetical protein